MEKIIRNLKNPKRALQILFVNHILRITAKIWPDKLYLRVKYFALTGKHLNLKNPKTFNEKINWMKLYDHNPLYSKLADKILVKDYVANLIGVEHIIPTLGVWDNPDDINLDQLPNQFVLKCNHNSGLGLFICKNKDEITEKKWEEVKENLRLGLKECFFWRSREWCYKSIKPRILAEKYMVDESGTELKDYKFFCFNGEPKFLFIAKDRGLENHQTKFDFFDMAFNHLPFTNGHPNSEAPYFKPDKFDEMKEIAAKLSKGLPEVRVDLYNINGKIYFGEMTFYHWGGFVPFDPSYWDEKIGEMFSLPAPSVQ